MTSLDDSSIVIYDPPSMILFSECHIAPSAHAYWGTTFSQHIIRYNHIRLYYSHINIDYVIECHCYGLIR